MLSENVPETAPDPDGDAAAFWQAIVRGETQAAQDTARRMRGEASHLTSSAYTFEEGELEERTEGENLLGESLVEPETPAPTLKLWNQDTEVPLLVVSQDRHCLARLGTAKAKQDFQACIKPS